MVAGKDKRGDLLICAVSDCILDACVTDAHAIKWDPAKVLESQEKKKKRKCFEARPEQRRRQLTHFVCSVDGMLGQDAKTFAKRLAARPASKWEKSHSQARGCVNARLSIAIVRATHPCA